MPMIRKTKLTIAFVISASLLRSIQGGASACVRKWTTACREGGLTTSNPVENSMHMLARQTTDPAASRFGMRLIVAPRVAVDITSAAPVKTSDRVTIPSPMSSGDMSSLSSASQSNQSDDPDFPIHPVGGIASEITPEGARGMLRAIEARRVIGGSLYDWATSNPGEWSILRPLRDLRPSS